MTVQSHRRRMTHHIGIHSINSLHAIGLGDVLIPPILIRTRSPSSLTAASIASKFLRTLEQQAFREPERRRFRSSQYHRVQESVVCAALVLTAEHRQ